VLGFEAGAAAEVDVEVVQAWRELAREQQAFVGECRELDVRLVRERVGRREQRDDGLAPDRPVGEAVGELGVEREGDVDRPGPQRARHAVGSHLFGQQLDVRVTVPERPPERRQRLEARTPVVADVNAAEFAGGGALGGASSSVRRAPLSSAANRHAERGLGHVQALGGAAEVQLLRHRDEIPQMAQLRHEPSVLPARYEIDRAPDAIGVSDGRRTA
jgi:hypothetical protein